MWAHEWCTGVPSHFWGLKGPVVKGGVSLTMRDWLHWGLEGPEGCFCILVSTTPHSSNLLPSGMSFLPPPPPHPSSRRDLITITILTSLSWPEGKGCRVSVSSVEPNRAPPWLTAVRRGGPGRKPKGWPGACARQWPQRLPEQLPGMLQATQTFDKCTSRDWG